MALSDRIRTIVDEIGISQKNFAKSINVTDSYISKLVRDETGMSTNTAMVIEQLYGYSKEWILRGKDPKMLTGRSHKLTGLQRKIIMDVEEMNENELRAVLAFIETLRKPLAYQYQERKAK